MNRWLIISLAGLLAGSFAWAEEERVSTFKPFDPGDVFVAATVMDVPDDDHAGSGRLFQFDADLKLKGVLWVEGTTHKIGALTFAPDGVLWGFAPISWQVVEIAPDGKQLPMRKYADRTLNSVAFGSDGSLYFGEHLVGNQRKISFNTTTFNYVPGTERIGDGHIFKFTPDGRFLEEFATDTHGGMAGIHGNSCMVLSTDGKRAIYISETGDRVMQYDLENRRQLADLADFSQAEDGPAMALFLTKLPDGTLVLATGASMVLMDPDNGALLGEIQLGSPGWAAVTPSTDAGHLLVGNFFTGEFIKLRIADGEVVARNTINEERSLSGIAQYAGPANRYETVIRKSEEAFMRRDLEGSIENLDEDYVLYDIKDEGPVPRMRGKENVRKILGQFFASDTSWVDSEVDKWGLLDNILVQVEYDSFESEDGVQVIPTLVVFEHRDGKRWREWRFRPADR